MRKRLIAAAVVVAFGHHHAHSQVIKAPPLVRDHVAEGGSAYVDALLKKLNASENESAQCVGKLAQQAAVSADVFSDAKSKLLEAEKELANLRASPASPNTSQK